MITTRFTELVGCSVPIQQAGMGSHTNPRLAAAVANAGGLGMVSVYGGYGGLFDLGMTTLANPFGYYSNGGMYNLLGTFDPLADPLLGFGMLSSAFL